MPTYGKTLREEMRVSGGAEEDFALGSPNTNSDGSSEDKPSWPALSYGALFLGLALLSGGKWLAGIAALAVFFVAMIRRAPSGAFYQKNDD